MNEIKAFKVGELYTNDQIRFSLAVENLGGIRPALDSCDRLRHVAIMTAAADSGKVLSDNPYQDRIEGDVLVFTAQGRKGDQQLRGRNKRLIEQYSVPIPIFGFVNVGKQSYKFLGLVELLRHYQELQADSKGTTRRAWVFEFRLHSIPEVVPIDAAQTLSAQLLSGSRHAAKWNESEMAVEGVASSLEEQSVFNQKDIERIRSQLLQLRPAGFEHFLERVMARSGFTRIAITGRSGDGGIDLDGYVDEANEFFAGTHVQVQAKRWRHSVGSIELNHFRGALSATAKGVLVTTSHFTRAALIEARLPAKPCITLLDGHRLSRLIQRLDLKVE